jgi:ethanolamine utilization microcompartment shell protein EutS
VFGLEQEIAAVGIEAETSSQAEAIVGETAASAAAIKNIGFMVQFPFHCQGLTTIVRDRLTVRRGRSGMDCPTM